MTNQEAQTAALTTLVAIAQDANIKVEIRVEAAKIILNRPRFFVDSDHEEK